MREKATWLSGEPPKDTIWDLLMTYSAATHRGTLLLLGKNKQTNPEILLVIWGS